MAQEKESRNRSTADKPVQSIRAVPTAVAMPRQNDCCAPEKSNSSINTINQNIYHGDPLAEAFAGYACDEREETSGMCRLSFTTHRLP